jgi:hypothetical protein
VGTDFGRVSTFLRSVFSILGGGLLCERMIGGEVGAGTAMRVVDGIEEGPGTGLEYDTESVGVGKYRKLVMR